MADTIDQPDRWTVAQLETEMGKLGVTATS
jgi:hypothetical protein